MGFITYDLLADCQSEEEVFIVPEDGSDGVEEDVAVVE